MQKNITKSDDETPTGRRKWRRWGRLVPFGGGNKSDAQGSGDDHESEGAKEGSQEVSAEPRGSAEDESLSALGGSSTNRQGVARELMGKVRGMRNVDNGQRRNVKKLKRAAEGGDAEAMYELGGAFRWGGYEVNKDVRSAVEWYERAILADGHTGAMFDLAYILHEGVDGIEKDVPRAASLYERAINEGGDVSAMVNLGNILRKGQDGMAQDKKRAVELYEHAIDLADDGQAMNELAIILQNDGGDLRDVRRAVNLYERAVEKGNCYAMCNLAEMLEYGRGGIDADVPRAIALYERAIEEGEHFKSMRSLGRILVDGKGGMERDVERGTALLERAMERYERSIEENGDVESMFGLAWILQFGTDQMKDVRRSAQLYERVIEEGGHEDSMVNLALILEDGGDGIDRDMKRALALYEMAAATGNEVAMCNLGHILVWGVDGMEEDGIGRDAERGLSLLEGSAAKGSSVAMNMLGFALIWGPSGVKKDAYRAVDLLARAMKGGEIYGLINLAFVLWRGIGGVGRDSCRAVQLLEGAVKEGNRVAMRHLAEVLRIGDDHVRRDVPRAKELLEELVLTPSDRRGYALESLALARLLLSEEAGLLRDPGHAKALLESVVDAELGPIYYELGSLLCRGDDGVEQEKGRGEELLLQAKSCGRYQFERYEFVCDPCTRHLLDAGEESSVIVEEAMRVAMCKPRLCFTLVMGGASRGKTSIVRSLQRECFLEEHEPTEFISLNRMGILRGGGIASDEAFRDMEFSCESLTANMSRAKGVVETQAERRSICGWPGKNVEQVQELQGAVEEREGGKSSDDGGERVLRCANARERKQYLASSKGDALGDENTSAAGFVSTEQTSARAVTLCSRVREEAECIGDSGGAQREEVELRVAKSRERRARVLERGRLALTEQIAVPKSEYTALLQCWDLGGQSQYVMAHALFIGYANILIFVVDLERFEDEETQEEEVKELCRWMQTAYSQCNDPKSVHAIIVGTRKGSCVDLEGTMEALKEKLREELGGAAYDEWVGRKGKERNKEEWPVFIGIENSMSIEDAVGSGLAELEKVVWSMAEEVVAKREEVPAGWIAFIEELEKSGKMMFWKQDIDEFVIDFPGFDRKKEVREEEAMCALQYYRRLGRIVVFEEDEGEYCVFVDPGKIVEFVRKVTGPEELMLDRLGKEAGLNLKRGILTRKGLSVLWGEYCGKVQAVMLKLLCKVDLLMLVKSSGEEGLEEDLIGVPALLPKWDGFWWKLRRGQSEVTMRTRFTDGLPPGLSGCVIAHLHRTIGGERTTEALLRSNGAILSLGGRSEVAIVFQPERREVWWVIRAEEPIGIAQVCLRDLSGFLDGPLRTTRPRRRNYFVFDCAKDKGGCGGTASVFFEIPEGWIGAKGWNEDEKWRNMSDWNGKCLDEQPWMLCDLLPLAASLKDTPERPLEVRESCTPYDVFISHAGAEKHSVAYPLREELAKLGWRSFLDEESLELSARTNDEQIRAAIRGSRAVMFVLSPSFVSRKWPMLELKLFYDEVDDAGKREEEKPMLVPLFYELTVEECGDWNLPQRSEYKGIFEESGFFSEAHQRMFSTQQAMALLKRLKGFVGVRNDEGETEREFAARAAAKLNATLKRKEAC